MARAEAWPLSGGPRQGCVDICGRGPDLGIQGAGRRTDRYPSYMCSDASGDTLIRLEADLERLSGQDLKRMFGPQVLDRGRRLLALKNRIDAELARTVREGELTQAAEHDGAKTMQSWLRGHGRLSAAAAHRLVVSG